jgi:galactokinase
VAADPHRAASARRARVASAFAARYGGPPTAWLRAPGRVDLMGSHTDYNEGHVLTMTLDRDTWLALRPRTDDRVAIASMDLPGHAEFALTDLVRDERAPWTDYVRGAAAVLVAEGRRLVGFDGLVQSTVPFGAGLSSSAAIEVAALLAFATAGGFHLAPLEAAILGQRAENEFVGVNCGILDQYTSALGQAGHALLLDCRHLESRPVRIAAHLAVVICDTRAERQLGATGYGDRRRACETGVARLQAIDPDIAALRDVGPAFLAAHEDALAPEVARRCRFIVEEERRVLELAEALPIGDPATLAALLDASWEGATRLFEIGAPAMSAMSEAMRGAPGIIGRRQAGAGFGGCLVAFVEREAVVPFSQHVAHGYAAATGIEAHIFAVEAGPGAGPLDSVT